jgi:ribokinase
MFEIITFGSATIDVFVDTDISEKKGFMYYPVGSKILLKNLRFDVGGGGTNTAVAFSRFDFKTGYIGKLGDDLDGQEVLKLLIKENVKFLGKMEKGGITGYSIVLDSKGGDRTILAFKGANNNLKENEISFRKIDTKWIYLSSLLGESFKTQKKLVDYLTRKGTKVAFNPSEYLIKEMPLGAILRLTDILVLNKEEGLLLAKKNGLNGKDLLKDLSSLGPRIVVITNKDKEVYAYDGEKKYSIIPHKINVVERTGAGDAFAAGFVAGQIAGKNISECLELGLKEGESVLKYFGAKNNLLRMDLKRMK